MTAILIGILLGTTVLVTARGESPTGTPSTTFPAAPVDARTTDEGWFAPLPKTAEKQRPEQAEDVFVIPIHGLISPTTYEAIKRKAIRCRSAGADLVIFDMKTPGGRSDAMSDIVQLILEEFGDIYTVAFINPKAYSAGAVISLACNEIVHTETSRIGDAMPIMIGPQGTIIPIPDKERGKIESAARAEIRVLGKRNGYSIPLCEGMITITMEVWLIRNPQTKELRIVDATDWRGRVTGQPASTQPSTATPPAKVDAQWEYVRTIAGTNELVTMTADEAIFLGIGSQIVDSMDELKEEFQVLGEAVTLRDTWSEKMVDFLTSAAVAGILLFVGALCIYLEINTPGFGVAGTIAVICFAILFGSRFLVGLAAWWEIALFVVGLVLIAVEIFVIPGFGIAGITGIICCVVGLLAMLVSNPPDKFPIPQTDLDWSIFTNGLMAVMIGSLLAFAAAIVLARYLPKAPVASRLILEVPNITTSAPATQDAPILSVEVGATGTVNAPCRPVGTVRVGETLIDAIADGGYISGGTEVKVVKVEGNRVVVTPLA